MRILMVYPQQEETFWSFKHALAFVKKKAVLPPLGLLTIAAMLPKEYEKKLIDMNVEKLKDKDILWADYVFISAMIVQKECVNKIVDRCKRLGVKVVAGGPLFTSLHQDFPHIDHLILNEGEVTLPLFLEDLKNGTPQRIYTSEEKPDMSRSPIPQWDLIEHKYYSKMPIQYSRGCPFDCEFCDIVNLNGKIPRTKSPLQIIKELNSIIRTGFRGSVFIVDDNFIGNKIKSKELLKAMIRWKKMTKYSINFMTEVSLNLADDEELLILMKDAGFDTVFIGLETPSAEGLQECGKFQNKNRDLVSSVKRIQEYGMEVSGGFIVGFDSDDASIFSRQIEFIQKSGVVVAMIGMLQALPNTKLYERLKRENRLLSVSTGNNTDFSTNFIPKLDIETLANGYNKIIASVYSPKKYYERVLTFLKSYQPINNEPFTAICIFAFFKSMWVLGVSMEGRKYYWNLLFTTIFKYPKAFPKAVAMSIYFAHFRKIFSELASNAQQLNSSINKKTVKIENSVGSI